MAKEDLIGLSVVEDLIVTCPKCNEKVANIVVSETNTHRVMRLQKPMKSKFIINCTCGHAIDLDGRVFTGATVVGAVDPSRPLNTLETDIEDDGSKTGIIVTKLEVVK